MHCRGWTVRSLAGCLLFSGIGGCASLDDYRRVEAQNRSLVATREAMDQQLFDARSANSGLRTQVGSLERELNVSKQYIDSMRSENALLDDLRNTAQVALEDIASRQVLGEISISGPKLPEPLHAALKRFSDQHPSTVMYDAPRGTVKWKSDLLFPIGSDVVKPASTEAIRAFAEIMKSPEASDFEVIVVGHTDNRPIVTSATKAKHPTNWHLSVHRAISVSSLLQKNGYTPDRIGIMGFGEFRPIADNSTPAGSVQNRRVETYIVPLGTLAQSKRTVTARGKG